MCTADKLLPGTFVSTYSRRELSSTTCVINVCVGVRGGVNMHQKKSFFLVFMSVNVHLYMCCDVKCQIRKYDQRLIITQLDYKSES